MDCPIHIDIKNMDLSISYLKEVADQTVYKMMHFCLWKLLYLNKQYMPWRNDTLCGINSGYSMFAKVPVYWYLGFIEVTSVTSKYLVCDKSFLRKCLVVN